MTTAMLTGTTRRVLIGGAAGGPAIAAMAGRGLTAIVISAAAGVLATAIVTVIPELFWLIALRQAGDWRRVTRTGARSGATQIDAVELLRQLQSARADVLSARAGSSPAPADARRGQSGVNGRNGVR
jgi:hypothetical protein